MIRVILCGVNGKMGREIVKAVYNDPELELVGAVGTNSNCVDVGDMIGLGRIGVITNNNLAEVIAKSKPQVMIDFTNPLSVMSNIRIALKNKVCPVVGTTGLSQEDLDEVGQLCRNDQVGAFIAPNFAIGAILMMKMAQEAAKYLPHVEIIEYHHDEKVDAPSGTALRTAELILKERRTLKQGNPEEFENLSGVRGGEMKGVRLHSVRLPGHVAHQEVIFGGLGQTLTIRHDSISRESFMPGITLACKKVMGLKDLVYGLEHVI